MPPAGTVGTVADTELVQPNTWVCVVAPAGLVITVPQTSQSPAVNDMAVASKAAAVVTGAVKVPVCTPDWLPLVLTAVPATALAIDVAIWKVLVVIVEGMVQ